MCQRNSSLRIKVKLPRTNLQLLILRLGKMVKVGSWFVCVLVCLVLVLDHVSAQQWDLNGEVNLCASKLNCSACIRTPECAWCAQPVSLIKHFFNSELHKKFLFGRILMHLKELNFLDAITFLVSSTGC